MNDEYRPRSPALTLDTAGARANYDTSPFFSAGGADQPDGSGGDYDDEHDDAPDTPSVAIAPNHEAPDASAVRTKFPVARIKRIMQADEDVGKVAQAAPVAVAKALELFMVSLVTKAAAEARARASRRVTAAHLKQAIAGDDVLDFLADIIERVPDAPGREPAAGSGNGGGAGGGAAPAPATTGGGGGGRGGGRTRRGGGGGGGGDGAATTRRRAPRGRGRSSGGALARGGN